MIPNLKRDSELLNKAPKYKFPKRLITASDDSIKPNTDPMYECGAHFDISTKVIVKRKT